MVNNNKTAKTIPNKPDDINFTQQSADDSSISSQTERIKLHFDDAAKMFDTFIQNLIPHYNDMLDIVTAIIPFDEAADFEVIDLGCGTGTVSYCIKKRFKNARITCMDISENMLQIAAVKVGDPISCLCKDLNTFKFDKKYDVVVSSLALHHLETDAAKYEMYEKIYGGLKENGIFINLDILLGSNEGLQSLNMEKWIAFMEQNVSSNEIYEKWLPNYYADDRPTSLIAHLNLMEKSKFKEIDVIYKYFNYAVFCGRKRESN